MLSALGDFQLAESAAAFLQEADEEELYSVVELRRFRCYEHTAIMSYARPFSQSKGSVPKLSLKQCGVKLTSTENDLHHRIIDLRNKLVAHSDLELMNFAAKTHDLSSTLDQQFFIIFANHDEGLQFSSFFEQIAFNDLISKVHFSLYKKLHDAAQHSPDDFDLKVHFPKK